jgi:hypothetical protein
MIIATSRPKKWKVGAELIKVYQGTEFSHVLIIKGDLVYQASHGLVHCAHIDNFTSDNDIVDFYEIDDSLVDMEFVYKQLGKSYSTTQIILVPFLKLVKAKYKGNKDSKFICSEFVGKALMLPWVDDITTPKDISVYLKNNYL